MPQSSGRKTYTTPLQQKVLNYVRDFWDTQGYGPSYTDIAHACGLYGRSNAHRIATCLIKQGHLVKHDYAPRSLMPVERIDQIIRQETGR